MRRTFQQRRFVSVEQLESRALCAVDMSVVNGDLVLQGTSEGAIALVDLGDGTIQVTQKGAAKDGSDLVTIQSGINDDILIRLGRTPGAADDAITLDLSKNSVSVDQVIASLGGGTNRFDFIGGEISGSLQYRGGSGDDTVSIEESVTVNGRASISLGDGDNLLEFQGTIGKSLLVFGGDGADSVELLAGGVVGGQTTIQLGDGTNELFSNAELGSGLVYRGGSGDDIVTLGDESLIDGNVRLRLGSGQNAASIDGTIAGDLSAVSANAEDSVQVEDNGNVLGRIVLGAGQQSTGRKNADFPFDRLMVYRVGQ
jgi:hypothetical protein